MGSTPLPSKKLTAKILKEVQTKCRKTLIQCVTTSKATTLRMHVDDHLATLECIQLRPQPTMNLQPHVPRSPKHQAKNMKALVQPTLDRCVQGSKQFDYPPHCTSSFSLWLDMRARHSNHDRHRGNT
ncbi:hypothetical protein KP509_16G012600 [Ceratopteris richardii]|uniref:Uncharacterized protein n=1 Tax=Ceratopteris richardii TaxID=49495 RepID=A0A8T2SY94_CERRI|nr:hypothetical protein KP509_16G012600 [Ceratopteris richardii]